MSTILKDQIRKCLLQLNEDRLKKLEYQDLTKKGGKSLPKGDEKVTRVEVALSNIDVPGMASTISSFAAKYKKFNDAKKEFEDLKKENKDKFIDLFKRFFDPEDNLITRVIKTAGYAVLLSKSYKRETLDKDKFVELLKENFKDSSEIIDKLYNECIKVSDVASSIDIEINESIINENRLTNLIKHAYNSIKNSITSTIKFIKEKLGIIDNRLDKLYKMLSSEQKAEYDKYIKHYSSIINESKFEEIEYTFDI